MKEPITKEDLKEHLKNFGEVLEAKIDAKMDRSKAEIEKSFTEKVTQIEEKFFKYSRQTTGIILGGVSVLLALYGILQYTFSNTNPGQAPINIYTYSQDQASDSAKSVVMPKANINQPSKHQETSNRE